MREGRESKRIAGFHKNICYRLMQSRLTYAVNYSKKLKCGMMLIPPTKGDKMRHVTNKRDLCVAMMIFFMLQACSNDGEKARCDGDTCKDGNILLSCDASGEFYVETPCPYGCAENHCKEAPSYTSCTQDRCAPDMTRLLVCDTATGLYNETPCPYGCDNNACKSAPEKCIRNECADEQTVKICGSDGTFSQRACAYGCVNGACAAKPTPKCTESVCKDIVTLNFCNPETGLFEEQSCNFCANGTCVELEITPCAPGTLPRCADEKTLIMCDTLDMGESWQEFKMHCIDGRSCQTSGDFGACVSNTPECYVSSCKDLKTLNVCKDGKQTPQACPEGQICVNDACVARQKITPCALDQDCASGEKCRHGLCYDEANLSLKIGDTCDWSLFQEYCDGDKEIKCGYDMTVEANDCASYNGCAVYVKPAYRTNAPVRNAACRGESHRLAECTTAGITGYECMNSVSEYYSFFMSLADACVVGTDGTMIHVMQRDQYNCGTSLCDEATGFCPGSSLTCPGGNCTPTDEPLSPVLGTSCDTDADAFCNGSALIYCPYGVGVWTQYTCPEGYVCGTSYDESTCMETCTELGSKSSVCGSGFRLDTVCTQLENGKFYVRDIDTLTECTNGCADNKECAPE